MAVHRPDYNKQFRVGVPITTLQRLDDRVYGIASSLVRPASHHPKPTH